MGTLEILLIAVGLAMDCFAVSVAAGITHRTFRCPKVWRAAFLFGLFQAIMPIIGWWVAGRFTHLVQAFDHWIAFGILAVLGIRMIRESFTGCENKKAVGINSLPTVLMLAIATSIDSLAVGITFAFLNMQTWQAVLMPVGIIGLVSFSLSLVGFCMGCSMHNAAKLRAELWGGVILIAIGLKILIEHLHDKI
ncbi:MAG: manganese efflux pump MntP family protein [Prevotellaceae bacterium]|jgi:putative Mn2+ efflux pump MntP|nr:manganese efflux pump MntP family protein [Prevotellaceae bacterium]